MMKALLLALAPLLANAKWCPAGEYSKEVCDAKWGCCCVQKFPCVVVCPRKEVCGSCSSDYGSDYTSLDGSTNCATAKEGQKLVKSGSTMSAQDCAQGKYQPEANQYKCLACEAGKSSQQGAASCTLCDPGRTSGPGGTCKMCNPRQESNDERTKCVDCRDGWISEGWDKGQRRLDEIHAPGPAHLQANATNITSDRRRLQPVYPNSPNCPTKMYDSTGGKAYNWACGAHCAGGSFTSGSCVCACQCKSGFPHNLISSGPCHDGQECTACVAGKTANSESNNKCVPCPEGHFSGEGGACTECPGGKQSNGDNTACVTCPDGYVSSKGGMCTTRCLAGEASNPERTKCVTCGAGTFSVGNQTECTKCGADESAWKLGNWDQDQFRLTRADSCLCASSRTGASCDLEVCAETNPVVSLGFLLLEAQWPLPSRTPINMNKAFAGISGAFRTFDKSGDNRLSVEDARAAIADGRMAVPRTVSHVWSRREEDGSLTKIYEPADACAEGSTCSLEGQYCPSRVAGKRGGLCCHHSIWRTSHPCIGDVTITDMIHDALDTLKRQQTPDYYERPSGSGNITNMTATYPNGSWDNGVCVDHDKKPPLLNWTVDRRDHIIHEQCAFFNGQNIRHDAGFDDAISSGGECNSNPEECAYHFQFPESYEIMSYYPGDVKRLNISKHSYCVETKFCAAGTAACNASTVDPALTVMRCTAGLQYDGTPADVIPVMQGKLGVSISFLYTSPDTKVYRIYKYDASVPFSEDNSARLLHEVVLSTAECGLTYEPINFRDTSTGATLCGNQPVRRVHPIILH